MVMTFAIITTQMNVPYRNRTYNWALGVRVGVFDSCQVLFIFVKQSLVFSNFPVLLCQDKLIEIILCKTFYVCNLLDFPTNRQSYLVPSNSLIWLPFTLCCVAMIAHLFLLDCIYYNVNEVGCRWVFDLFWIYPQYNCLFVSTYLIIFEYQIYNSN